MANIIKKLLGGSKSEQGNCCGVQIEEVKSESANKESTSCCGTDENSSTGPSCCGTESEKENTPCCG
ncbi:hypothetical protein [Brevibacillus sp. SYSU BS000544]|uniref:hypothetical protein n=1 Tax=Brevibacillus sp. SYSU BS000544 TaxID=3416443 RepID=UPI003CE45857